MSVKITITDHILLEDPYIMVLHKPAGLMVEPDRNGHPNLLHQVRAYLKVSGDSDEPVYIQHIHRLDRPASGIILFAKQKLVLKNLSEQFAERKVKKYYQALTTPAPPILNGTLEGWHKKEKKRAILFSENFPGTEKVSLRYAIKPFLNNYFLWDIELHTGKYHQIRAQLAAAGCAILGDTLYGSENPYKPDSIALHACKLIFSHPITHEKVIVTKQNEF